MPPGRKSWITDFARGSIAAPPAARNPRLDSGTFWARLRRKFGSVRPSPPSIPTWRKSRRVGLRVIASLPAHCPAHGLPEGTRPHGRGGRLGDRAMRGVAPRGSSPRGRDAAALFLVLHRDVERLGD